MDKPVVQSRRTRAAAAARPHLAQRSARSDGASTRSLILEAARRRLIEGGYANLNVRDIARDAGVNHALIGYHFRGKQQLVLAVLDDANTHLLDRQARMYDQQAGAALKWQQACAFYEEDLRSGFVKLLMELMGASFHDEALRREFTPRMLAWHKLVESAVQDFIRDSGLHVPISPRAISAWIGWFWMGMEASMALGIPEKEGHQREALDAVAAVLRHAEGLATAARKRTTRRRSP